MKISLYTAIIIIDLKKSEIGLLWNDPKLKIMEKKKKLIISKKDKNNLK